MTFTPPKTYTAYAVVEKGGKPTPIEVAWKEPTDGQVVVKVLACGVCSSDRVLESHMFGNAFPRIPGHEIVGEIVAVPASEKKWKLGAYVGGGWHGGHCGDCKACRAGDFACCDCTMYTGVAHDGGYAQYATIRSESVIEVPKEMSPVDAAPMICAGLTAYNAIRNMKPTPGDVAVVSGIGGVGHMAIQFCNAFGLHVVALSTNEGKRKDAEALGAHNFINPNNENAIEEIKKLGGASLVVVTSPITETVESLVGCMNHNGKMLLLSIDAKITLPVVPLLAKRLSVHGFPFGTAKDAEDTLRFVQLKKIRAVTKLYKFAETPQAYDDRATARFRGVIQPWL